MVDKIDDSNYFPSLGKIVSPFMSDNKKYHSIDAELFLNQEMFYNSKPKVFSNKKLFYFRMFLVI